MTRSEDDGWYWQRGGGVVGGMYLSWPFVVLSVGPDGIEFRVLMRRYPVARSEIRELRVMRGLFSWGVSISHDASRGQEELIFWSPDVSALIEAFESKGYLVHED